MSWNPKDFCKEGYYGINYKQVPVCGKDNYESPCIFEKCELYRIKKKGLEKFYVNQEKKV